MRALFFALIAAFSFVGCGSCAHQKCTSQIVVGIDPATGKVVTPIVTTCVCLDPPKETP